MTRLTIDCIETVREGLMAAPPVWPEDGPVDTTGIQLLIAAARAGIAPPAELLARAEVVRRLADLGVDPSTCLAPSSR